METFTALNLEKEGVRKKKQERVPRTSINSASKLSKRTWYQRPSHGRRATVVLEQQHDQRMTPASPQT